jgi:hypothetical protein
MTFKPGMYVGNDHGSSSEPYWTPYLDNAEVWLTGNVSFPPGFLAMQYMGPYVFNTSFEDWTLAGAVNACARAYAWVTAQPNRKIIFRTAPGFAGSQGGGGPYGKAGFDAVANGTWTTMTQNMVTTLWNAGGAGARPGLLPYVIIDPWWEGYAYWFNWAFSNDGHEGVAYAGVGDWRGSVYNAYRKYIDDAKAKETALTGLAPTLKFGFTAGGVDAYSIQKTGYSFQTGGPAGTGVYPGDAYIDYMTPTSTPGRNPCSPPFAPTRTRTARRSSAPSSAGLRRVERSAGLDVPAGVPRRSRCPSRVGRVRRFQHERPRRQLADLQPVQPQLAAAARYAMPTRCHSSSRRSARHSTRSVAVPPPR